MAERKMGGEVIFVEEERIKIKWFFFGWLKKNKGIKKL